MSHYLQIKKHNVLILCGVKSKNQWEKAKQEGDIQKRASIN